MAQRLSLKWFDAADSDPFWFNKRDASFIPHGVYDGMEVRTSTSGPTPYGWLDIRSGAWMTRQNVRVWEDADKLACLNHNAGPGGLLSRVDLFVGRHVYAAAVPFPAATYEIVEGTPALIPTATAIPENCVLLGAGIINEANAFYSYIANVGKIIFQNAIADDVIPMQAKIVHGGRAAYMMQMKGESAPWLPEAFGQMGFALYVFDGTDAADGDTITWVKAFEVTAAGRITTPSGETIDARGDSSSLGDRLDLVTAPIDGVETALDHGAQRGRPHLADMPDNGSLTVDYSGIVGVQALAPINALADAGAVPSILAITFHKNGAAPYFQCGAGARVYVEQVGSEFYGTYLLPTADNLKAVVVRVFWALFNAATNDGKIMVVTVNKWGGLNTDHETLFLSLRDVHGCLGGRGVAHQFFPDIADVYAVLLRAAGGLKPSVVGKGNISDDLTSGAVDNNTVQIIGGQLVAPYATPYFAVWGLQGADYTLPYNEECVVPFDTLLQGQNADKLALNSPGSGQWKALRSCKVRVTASLRMLLTGAWWLDTYRATLYLCVNGNKVAFMGQADGTVAAADVISTAGDSKILQGTALIALAKDDILDVRAVIVDTATVHSPSPAILHTAAGALPIATYIDFE